MTIDEVLAHIKDDPGTAWTNNNGRIRAMGDSFATCPICWLATKMGKNPYSYVGMYWCVNGSIGLPDGEAVLLADVADNALQPDADPEAFETCRAKLLEACRLTPSA